MSHRRTVFSLLLVQGHPHPTPVSAPNLITSFLSPAVTWDSLCLPDCLEPLCVGQPDCGLRGVTWAVSRASLWDTKPGSGAGTCWWGDPGGRRAVWADPGKMTQPGRTDQGSEGRQVRKESWILTLQAHVLNFTFPFIYFFCLNPVSLPEASNLLFNIGLCD